MNHTHERRAAVLDEEIFERDGFKCVYCDFDGSTFKGWAFLAIDHLKPRHLGGGNERENLKTACIVCNAMKGGASYPDQQHAREALRAMWVAMEGYWEKHVRRRVTTKRAADD